MDNRGGDLAAVLLLEAPRSHAGGESPSDPKDGVGDARVGVSGTMRNFDDSMGCASDSDYCVRLRRQRDGTGRQESSKPRRV